MAAKPHLALVPRTRVPDDDSATRSDLIDQLRAGEPEARDRLYRVYAQPVWRFLRRILGPDPELEDLHHEVFVQALRSAHRFDERSSLLSWLKGIAVNCTRNMLRSRRRRSWLHLFAPHDLPDAPVRGEDLSEEVAAVYRVLDALPADERLAFSLRYFEGMKVAEIAAACGVSVGTVGRRLRRARAGFFREAALDPVLQERIGEEETR